jgi:hypothetical protein
MMENDQLCESMSMSMSMSIPMETDGYNMSQPIDIDDNIYNMSEMKHAIDEAAYESWVRDPLARQVIQWIAHTDHTFPKRSKGWINCIQQQFNTIYHSVNTWRYTTLTAHSWMNNMTVESRVAHYPDNVTRIKLHDHVQNNARGASGILKYLVDNGFLRYSASGSKIRANKIKCYLHGL